LKGEVKVKKTASGIMLILLFVSVLSLAFNIQPVKAGGTIYIRADGSIDPPTAPIHSTDNITYTFTGNIYDSIVVERDNIIIDGAGNTVQGSGSGKGIDLSGRSNVTIKNTQIMFQRTPLTSWDGIYLLNSYNNSISGNNITAGDLGLSLQGSSNNTISGNHITNNGYGIYLLASFNNMISGNSITNNGYGMNGCGIDLVYSSNNTIFGNSITNNGYGIYLYESSNNNSIYHNNFINNIEQVYSSESTNVWDDGYPSGGNYWKYYADFDLKSGSGQDQPGSDGIGDAPYIIDANNTDRFPLSAPISEFDAGTWNGIAYNVDIVSNSTLSDFYFSPDEGPFLKFNVTGDDGTSGFCRVTIPNVVVQDLWQGNYAVLLNGESWPFRNWTDATNTYIYINYTHSEHEIIIIPEFPSTIILPLVMILSTIAIVFAKKKRRKQRPDFQSLIFLI
jgi:parallel beta-helix repeat protein